MLITTAALAVALTGAGLAVAINVVGAFLTDLPSVDELTGVGPQLFQTTTIQDRQGRPIGELLGQGRRKVLPPEQIPSVVRQAVIAAEDATFYENPGVEPRAILRAIWQNLRGGRVVSGASTITQQLVKNALLTPEETVERKLKEAVLAWQISQRFSKDEILWKTFSSHHTLLYGLGLLTAMMTAFYMFRLIYMTFHGDNRVAPGTHVHESPRSMTVPLGVLAVGSILAGWVGTPPVFGPVHDALPSLEHWLSSSVALEGAHGGAGAEHPSALLEWGLMALAVGLALAAIWFATRLFRTAKYEGEPMHGLVGRGFHRVLLNKYFVDEIYGAAFVDGAAKGGGGLMARFDRRGIDAMVNGVGGLTRHSSSGTMFFDKWVIDGIVNVVGFGTKLVSYPVRMFQTGLVQNYALHFVIGVGIVAGYYLFR